MYLDGDNPRSIRGIDIVDKDPIFLTLLRQDGSTVRFNKNIIQKIEEVECGGY